MLDSDADEKELDEEVRLVDTYVKKFTENNFRVQSRLITPGSPESLNGFKMSKYTAVRTKPKLPTVQLAKLSGVLKHWLPFWAQFKRIDEDQDIDDIKKYHYLVQAIVTNSRASQIVESYPSTFGNYS